VKLNMVKRGWKTKRLGTSELRLLLTSYIRPSLSSWAPGQFHFLHPASDSWLVVTQTLRNSNFPLTWSNFHFPSDHLIIISNIIIKNYYCYFCFIIIHLVIGGRYQLGNCPVSCSSSNIYFISFHSTLFSFI